MVAASSWMQLGSAASMSFSRGLRRWSDGWSTSSSRFSTRPARLSRKAEACVLPVSGQSRIRTQALAEGADGGAYLLCEEKRLTGWKQGHTPEKRFEAPAFGGGFFLLLRDRSGRLTASRRSSQRGRPPFPVERRPSSLVCALQSTCSVKLYPRSVKCPSNDSELREEVEASGLWQPWGHWNQV